MKHLYLSVCVLAALLLGSCSSNEPKEPKVVDKLTLIDFYHYLVRLTPEEAMEVVKSRNLQYQTEEVEGSATCFSAWDTDCVNFSMQTGYREDGSLEGNILQSVNNGSRPSQGLTLDDYITISNKAKKYHKNEGWIGSYKLDGAFQKTKNRDLFLQAISADWENISSVVEQYKTLNLQYSKEPICTIYRLTWSF